NGEALHLYALFNSHLGREAKHWLGDYKGVSMLFAEGEGATVALACSLPWRNRSVGFVGVSDGWRDLKKHRRLKETYDRADGGNAVLTGEVDTSQSEFLLAIAFGRNECEAGFNARAALLQGWEGPLNRYKALWRDWQKVVRPVQTSIDRARTVYRASAAMLRVHEAKLPPGAAVASLSIPWGGARIGDKVGGYHLVWPRDLVEIAGGLLAIDVADHVHATLEFLETTQESDGHWLQNMRLDGEAFWDGIQLDETALAILLVGFARRKEVLTEEEELRFWPMVKRAAGSIARTGPATPEDRWEHDGGFSPFTLAAEINALLAAADLAERCGDCKLAKFLRETADLWNAGIERWSYRSGTALAGRLGIAGYYTREGKSETRGGLPQSDEDKPPTDEDTISPDALALVRFGLRRPDDPRILDTVKAIDSVLRVEFSTGPGWRRHKEDKYGEYADGRPRDSHGGIGRVWPLLAGERGHYELAAGRRQEVERMLRAMEAAATDTGLIPEQIWDADDIPQQNLYRGRPTGSACPLPWAHAEYLKLTRSLQDGEVFD
ncbi:MAG TPA: glycoside hydrolase family 15 protein, partial [Gemmataceae bacterium]